MTATDETILWHDYETSGLDTRRDRPMSFAAVRTDMALQEIGEPVVVEFAIGDDVIPSPDACLVTRLDPDREGTVSELQGAYAIFNAMIEPNTCSAGYNNMRFDDEVTRFMFWRNLMPAFDREWRNGNSRFDLIDVLRHACALRPGGLTWPVGDMGWPSMKLESLCNANGIEYAAHEALADVRATIEMARRLAEAQPELFAYLLDGRNKKIVKERMRGFGKQPFVHTSSRIPAKYRSTSLVMRIADHPRFANQILCFDLRHDPQVILDHGIDELRHLLFTPRDQQADDAPRVGIKGLHFGRAPVVSPREVLDEASIERLELDMALCDQHAALIEANRDAIADKALDLFDEEGLSADDVDEALYDGFVEGADAGRCREVHDARSPDAWRNMERQFDDDRLGELLFRMRARNHPEYLVASERARWQKYCQQRQSGAEAALARIAELRQEDGVEVAVLDTCEAAIRRRVAAVSEA